MSDTQTSNRASESNSRKHYRSRFWKFPRKFSARTLQCFAHRHRLDSLSPVPSFLKGRAKSEGVLSSDEDEDEQLDRKTVDQLELSRMSSPHMPNCIRISDSLILSNSFASLSVLQMNKDKSRATPKLRRKTINTVEADGNPPAGYLWIWMGVLRRWHRNYFLLETPGVLTHSRIRGSQMKGAFCLRDSRVIASHGHSRQFCIVSPAGVGYFRSVRKDQRGAWISSIRASIDKYTQCIQQAEKANSVAGSLVYCEPEQAKLALEVKTRTRALMTELEPYKESLRTQLNLISTRVLSIQGLLGDPNDVGAPQGRPLIRQSTETTVASRNVTSPTVAGLENGKQNRDRVEKERLTRHPSLRDGFGALQRQSSNAEVQTRLTSARSANLSADDLLLSTSLPLKASTEDAGRVSKSLTPRPSTNSRRSHMQYSPNLTPLQDLSKTTEILSSNAEGMKNFSHNSDNVGSPFLRSSEEPIPEGSTLWSRYHSFMRAVQTAIQKEAQAAMELKAENSALRKMLQNRRTESQVNGEAPSQLISGSTSRSYSTAESEFDVNLLENSDDDPEAFEVTTSLASHSLADIAEDKQTQEELLDALEVVRRADYVTRNSSKNVALVVNLSNGSLPKQYEDDDEDSESQLENEACYFRLVLCFSDLCFVLGFL